MSSEHPENSIVRTWTNTYLAITLGFGFLLFWLLFAETEYATAAKLIFLAVFILTLKRWTGAVLFAFCQLQLVFLEPTSPLPLFTLDAAIWSVLSLGMLVVVSRYRTLQDRDTTAAHKSLFQLVRSGINGQQTKVDGSQISLAVRQLAKAAAILLLCSVAAWAILGLFPTNTTTTGLNSVREYRLSPTGYRLLVCGLTLFTGFLVVWLFVNELCWRRMNPRQSRIYLSSVLLKFLYRDLRIVTRKRLKLRKKHFKSSHQSGDILKQD